MRRSIILLIAMLSMGTLPAHAEHNPPWTPAPPPPFNPSTAWLAGYTEGFDEAMQGRFDNDNSGERAMGYLSGHQAGTRVRNGRLGWWDGQFRQPGDTSYLAGYTEGVDEGMQGRWHNDNSGVRAVGYIDGYSLSLRIRRGEGVSHLIPTMDDSSWQAGYTEGLDEAMQGRWHNDNSGTRALGYIAGYLRGRQIAQAEFFGPGDGDPRRLDDSSYVAGWVEGVDEALTRGWHNDNSGMRAIGYVDGYVLGLRIKKKAFFYSDGQVRLPADSSYQSGYTEGYSEAMQGRWHNDNSALRAVGYVDGWMAGTMNQQGLSRDMLRARQFQELQSATE